MPFLIHALIRIYQLLDNFALVGANFTQQYLGQDDFQKALPVSMMLPLNVQVRAIHIYCCRCPPCAKMSMRNHSKCLKCEQDFASITSENVCEAVAHSSQYIPVTDPYNATKRNLRKTRHLLSSERVHLDPNPHSPISQKLNWISPSNPRPKHTENFHMIEFEYGALPYKPVTAPSSDGVAHVYTLVHTGRGPRQVLACLAPGMWDQGVWANLKTRFRVDACNNRSCVQNCWAEWRSNLLSGVGLRDVRLRVATPFPDFCHCIVMQGLRGWPDSNNRSGGTERAWRHCCIAQTGLPCTYPRRKADLTLTSCEMLPLCAAHRPCCECANPSSAQSLVGAFLCRMPQCTRGCWQKYMQAALERS